MSDDRVTALCNGVDNHAARETDGGDRVALKYALELSKAARTLVSDLVTARGALAEMEKERDSLRARLNDLTDAALALASSVSESNARTRDKAIAERDEARCLGIEACSLYAAEWTVSARRDADVRIAEIRAALESK